MTANEFGAGVLLLVLLVSAASYDHRRGRYADGKADRIESPRSFAWVYRYIQLSTAVVGFAGFLTSHALLLQVHRDPRFVVAGSVVALGGLAVFFAAKRTLGKHYSPCFDSYVPQGVIQSGVYRFVRHPIYTGNFFVVGGLAVATGSLWMVLNLALLVFYYTGSAKREEAALSAQFDDYRAYLSESGRFLPRLWSSREGRV